MLELDAKTGSNPGATLVAATDQARRALGADEVPIVSGSFKFGRERRSSPRGGKSPAGSGEQRRGAISELNDVYLPEDPAAALQIAGAHFTIEHTDGQFWLTDRGSSCGTVVAGKRLGGRRKGGKTELHDGDEIIVGTRSSPYIFKFRIDTATS
ncbi:MAG: FHA domain-containing protein [Acidobacteria bacterium]|nr:FHA domain-containing protein [Acidobacteriota bacterium]